MVLLVREDLFCQTKFKVILKRNSSVKPDQDQDHEQVDKNIIEQGQDEKSMIVVCKDERDWINPETGFHYVGFEMGDINMIAIKNIDKFKNSIIVLDDLGSEYSRHINNFLQKEDIIKFKSL